MQTTFTQHKPGDVIVTITGRVMLITGEMEPFLYTAIDHVSGDATAIDAAHIDHTKEVTLSQAMQVRQAYLDTFYHPSQTDSDTAFIEAMLGNRAGSHEDLLTELRRDVNVKALAFRGLEMGTPESERAMLLYVRSLERHYQAVTKFNPDNDDYRNLRHVSKDETQPIITCVFKAGGYCDCPDAEWKDDYCSSDDEHIRSNNQ